MSCSQCNQGFAHVYTEGDRLPEIEGTFANVDLTGYTVEFALLRPDGSVVAKSSATSGVTITNASAGQFSVQWDAADLVVGRNQTAQITILDADSKPLTTQDFLLSVKEKLSP